MDAPRYIYVEYKTNLLRVRINENTRIIDIKRKIKQLFGVRPKRQKLINVDLNDDETKYDYKVWDLRPKLNPEMPLMMIKIKKIFHRSKQRKRRQRGRQVPSLQKIVTLHFQNHGFKILNPPRPHKKLLVLDIDLTIYDVSLFNSSEEQKGIRPYLHKFLKNIYVHYDIMLWSNTPMLYIEKKAKLLGIKKNPDYKIMCYIDKLATSTVSIAYEGLIRTKPLSAIWRYFKLYDYRNTIICDDVSHNFHKNRRNGILVSPYFYKDKKTDFELRKLEKYLIYIATHCTNFTRFNHVNWKNFEVPRE